MFSFEGFLDLPMIWLVLLTVVVYVYVILDGFDLGVGILFPFAPSDKSRDTMMNSIAPFWDGNETWLVLGGGGLFAAFPLAYAVLMPAFYMPIILMLLGLIFRGVAFEFRFKANTSKILWDRAFYLGSLLATFSQGVVLGAFVQGVTVEGRRFAGGAFDWLTPFSIMVGLALVCGYALLGATWLIMKTEDDTQAWARRSAIFVLKFVVVFMALVSWTMPYIHPGIRELWFSWPNMVLLSPMPLLSVGMLYLLWKDLNSGQREFRPFFLSLGLFLMNYIGLGISMWPWLVPFQIDYRQAAAAPESQSLLLVGTVIMLPIILGYAGYCYYLFRGKASSEHEEAY